MIIVISSKNDSQLFNEFSHELNIVSIIIVLCILSKWKFTDQIKNVQREFVRYIIACIYNTVSLFKTSLSPSLEIS